MKLRIALLTGALVLIAPAQPSCLTTARPPAPVSVSEMRPATQPDAYGDLMKVLDDAVDLTEFDTSLAFAVMRPLTLEDVRSFGEILRTIAELTSRWEYRDVSYHALMIYGRTKDKESYFMSKIAERDKDYQLADTAIFALIYTANDDTMAKLAAIQAPAQSSGLNTTVGRLQTALKYRDGYASLTTPSEKLRYLSRCASGTMIHGSITDESPLLGGTPEMHWSRGALTPLCEAYPLEVASTYLEIRAEDKAYMATVGGGHLTYTLSDHLKQFLTPTVQVLIDALSTE